MAVFFSILPRDKVKWLKISAMDPAASTPSADARMPPRLHSSVPDPRPMGIRRGSGHDPSVLGRDSDMPVAIPDPTRIPTQMTKAMIHVMSLFASAERSSRCSPLCNKGWFLPGSSHCGWTPDESLAIAVNIESHQRWLKVMRVSAHQCVP
jgi:hypothetical protein